MGINIFYKVRAERDEAGNISTSEKGLLRFLRTPRSRDNLRQETKKFLVNNPQTDSIYSTYVFDLIDGRQIAYFDKETAERIGLA